MTAFSGSFTSLATMNVGWCLLVSGALLMLALLTIGDPRARFRAGRRLRRHDRTPLWRKLLAGLLAVVSCLVLATGASLWWVRRDLLDNISTVALDHPSEPKVDNEKSIWEQYPDGRNLLLLGSDTREGVGTSYGSSKDIEGARSDTAILVHVSGDGQWMSGVSIPRDTVMDLPLSRKACGRQPSDLRDRFNVAFEVGGPACTVAAAERLTGLQVDNVLVVNFDGFRKIVDALGGLQVCLRHDVHDTKALLDLPAGTRKLGGKDTLALMRARKSLGNGSDIGRTARQQYLLTETVAQVRSGGLLHKPAKLYRVASAATKSLTTDEGLGSVDALLDLAQQLSGVEEKRIHLRTIPWLPDPANPQITIVMDEEKAQKFLRSMARDQEPGVKQTTPTTTATTTPAQPGEEPTTTTTTRPPRTTTTTTTDPSVADLFCDVS